MRKGAVIFFYVLVGYMFISFSWWTVLLLEKNNDAFVNEQKFLELTDEHKNFYESPAYLKLEKEYVSQRRMILSEAIVMMMLLMAGTFQLYRTFRKEMDLNRRQKNFLLSITHELKSPLASAKLTMQTLQKRNQLDDEKYFRLLNNGLNDVERLHILVNNLLLSARIEDHSYQPSLDVINISDIAEEIFGKAKENFRGTKNIELSIEPNLLVIGDTLSLQTVVSNIIENAIKYTPENATIQCALIHRNNEVLITIADNGLGIPEREKEKIFSKFYRVGNEDTRATTGTGLGLYMVRELLKLLNGKITVRDNQPVGVLFEIQLPLAQIN